MQSARGREKKSEWDALPMCSRVLYGTKLMCNNELSRNKSRLGTNITLITELMYLTPKVWLYRRTHALFSVVCPLCPPLRLLASQPNQTCRQTHHVRTQLHSTSHSQTLTQKTKVDHYSRILSPFFLGDFFFLLTEKGETWFINETW